MREFLASDMPGLVTVAQISLEIDAVKTKLAGVDFAAPDGQMKAVGFQGQIKGLNRSLDLIIEIANFEEPA